MFFLFLQLFFTPPPEASEFSSDVWREAFIAERKNFDAINKANYQCLSDRRHYLSEAERFAEMYNKCAYTNWKLEKTIKALRARLKKNNKSSRR